MMEEFSQAKADPGVREFSQAVTRQPGIATNYQALVPGMSQYGESDVDARRNCTTRWLVFFNSTANNTEIPLFWNGSQGVQ